MPFCSICVPSPPMRDLENVLEKFESRLEETHQRIVNKSRLEKLEAAECEAGPKTRGAGVQVRQQRRNVHCHGVLRLTETPREGVFLEGRGTPPRRAPIYFCRDGLCQAAGPGRSVSRVITGVHQGTDLCL